MTQENGYCLAYRRAWSHDAFKDLLEAAIWNFLYQNAFYEDGERTFNGTVLYLKRGQIATTPRFLAKGFRISESSARRVIQKLIKLKTIETQSTTKATIITICNYDKYQLSTTTSGDQSDDQTKTKPRPNDANNNKTIKPKKEENNKISRVKKREERELIFPTWMDENLIYLWNEFIEMRIKIKKPPTHLAKEILLSTLEKLFNSGQDPSKVLQQSIVSNWQSLFPIKENKNHGKQYNNQQPTAHENFTAGIALALNELD